MKINKYALLALGIFFFHSLNANNMEEVVVTSAIINSNISNTADVIHIVDEDSISTEASQSLGEAVDDLLGYYFLQVYHCIRLHTLMRVR